MRTATLLLFVLLSVKLWSQSNVICYAYNSKDTTLITDAHLTLLKGNNIAYQADPKPDGTMIVPNVEHGSYVLELDALGFDTHRDTITVDEVKVLHVLMDPREGIELNELTVTANRSDIAGRTVGGRIFYLSEKAKKEKDPFRALDEIPMLVPDVAKGNIKTIYGDQPYILVNGMELNTGVAPLNPSEIVSVEVVTDPPARYRMKGYTALVNITVRRHEGPYVWVEGRTNHSIPLDNGDVKGTFEVGNPKVSLFGNVGFNYKYNNETVTDQTRSNGDYTQNMHISDVNNERNWNASMMLKFNPDDKNYYAAKVAGNWMLSKAKSTGTGDIAGVSNTYSAGNRTPGGIATAMLYYNHKFENKNQIQAIGTYNFTNSKDQMGRHETFADEVYDIFSKFRSSRHSGQLELAYIHHLSASSQLQFSLDAYCSSSTIRYLDRSNPDYNYRNATQMPTVGWNGVLFNKLMCLANVFVNSIYMSSEGQHKYFITPGGMLFVDYALNQKNSFSLTYTGYGTPPSLNELNPFNTSTDPLQISCGNPNLDVERTDKITFKYTYMYKRWFVNFNTYYTHISKQVENFRYVNSDGIIVSTYNNMGYNKNLMFWLMFNYRFPFGRIYAGVGSAGYFFPHQASHFNYMYQAGFSFNFKKFSLYGEYYYRNKAFSRYAMYEYHQPTDAKLECIYQATPDLFIGVNLRNFTGTYEYDVDMKNGDYTQQSRCSKKYMSFRPGLTVRYTFRANSNRKIKMDTQLESTEKGIDIKAD